MSPNERNQSQMATDCVIPTLRHSGKREIVATVKRSAVAPWVGAGVNRPVHRSTRDVNRLSVVLRQWLHPGVHLPKPIVRAAPRQPSGTLGLQLPILYQSWLIRGNSAPQQWGCGVGRGGAEVINGGICGKQEGTPDFLLNCSVNLAAL